MVTQEDGKLQLQQLTSSLTFPHGAPEVWKDLCRVRPMKGGSMQQKFWKIALQPPLPLPFLSAVCNPLLFGSAHSCLRGPTARGAGAAPSSPITSSAAFLSKGSCNRTPAPVQGEFPGLAVPPHGQCSLSTRLLPRSPCCSLGLSGTTASLHQQPSDHLVQRQNMIIMFRGRQSLM